MARPLPEGLRTWFAERLESERKLELRCVADADSGEPTFLIRADMAAGHDLREDLRTAERTGSRIAFQALDASFAALLGEDKESN